MLLFAVVSACTPLATATPPPPSSVAAPISPSPTDPARSTANPPATSAYVVSVIYESDTWPTAVAATETQVFIGLVALGARPSDTRSKIAFILRRDGTRGIVLGSETLPGIGITGLATHAGALFFSTASVRTLAEAAVWRAAGGLAGAIVGGPGSPANLDSGNRDGGPATSAALQGPAGLAFGPNGDMYIAEAGDSRVRVVRAGRITTYAGGNGVGSFTDLPSGSASTARLSSVDLIAAARDGSVYAAQSRSKWIARIAPDGTVATISNSFAVGGLAVSANGALLASDTDAGRIVRFPTAAHDPPVVVASALEHPTAIAAASDGALYVATWRQTSPSTAVTWQVLQFLPRP